MSRGYVLTLEEKLDKRGIPWELKYGEYIIGSISQPRGGLSWIQYRPFYYNSKTLKLRTMWCTDLVHLKISSWYWGGIVPDTLFLIEASWKKY